MKKSIKHIFILILATTVINTFGFSKSNRITIQDAKGKKIKINLPVKRIISLNSGLSALIAALGEEKKIIGRDSFSTFPSTLRPVYVVGKNSAHPNLELIIQQKPDLLVADTMLDIAIRKKLEALGISVYIANTSNPDKLFNLINNLGIILEKSDKAEEIAFFIKKRLNLVTSRIKKLADEKQEFPLVFFENRKKYKSASAKSNNHIPLMQAGAVNIAAGEPVSSPSLSIEYILIKNPDIIIRRMSGDASLEQMKTMQENLTNRIGLNRCKAVKNKKVYIIKADILMTLRYPIGLLYYAKWFHPSIFQDIDPEEEHKKLINRFYGPQEWNKISEKFTYPLK